MHLLGKWPHEFLEARVQVADCNGGCLCGAAERCASLHGGRDRPCMQLLLTVLSPKPLLPLTACYMSVQLFTNTTLQGSLPVPAPLQPAAWQAQNRRRRGRAAVAPEPLRTKTS